MPHVYKEPGIYVAICNKTNWDGHYTKVFVMPEVCEAGASWYFLNKVDFVACLEAVYPISLFNTTHGIGLKKEMEREMERIPNMIWKTFDTVVSAIVNHVEGKENHEHH